jgi:hypothetical protein
VRALRGGADQIGAFQNLVGQPLPEFEAQLHRFLVGLRPDGTVRTPPPP